MGGAAILMYHRIGNGRLPERKVGEHYYAVAPADFEAQLDVLAATGAAIAVEDCVAARRPLPARAVAITFDDGNASDHAIAFDALCRRGLRAAFFVTPAWVGRPGYMSWAEVRELKAGGMDVGAHGLDHTLLATLEDGALREHLHEARRTVEAGLGEAPRWLALPDGSGDRREVAAARDAGFDQVFGSVPGLARQPPVEDPIPRFAIRRNVSAGAFRALVEHRASARLQSWLRHQTIAGLRGAFGMRRLGYLRSTWMTRAGDE
jgi:peptidoglycan/xylan/chitin deacetylase (PgdA/CDA1 family)